MIDRSYCMSSYLASRTIANREKSFANKIVPRFYDNRFSREHVHSSEELESKLRKSVISATKNGHVALALSGGIDSAILAKFMPVGSIAYTFKCVVPGINVADESDAANRYARECGLRHKIIEIYWDDFKSYAPLLMKQKGMPIHSIEVQIYKAALQAKIDGHDCLIFGESADANYGGLNNLLSKDWTVGEFMDRYSFVKPYYALKKFKDVSAMFLPYVQNGYINVHEFVRNFFYQESMATYTNACDLANIKFEAPYARTFMAESLDLERIRRGENKYWVRNIFRKLYPDYELPPKLPMPRATNEWLKEWEGPSRSEFWPHCHKNMTGDQRWLVYCLEWYLNLLEEGYF